MVRPRIKGWGMHSFYERKPEYPRKLEMFARRTFALQIRWSEGDYTLEPTAITTGTSRPP